MRRIVLYNAILEKLPCTPLQHCNVTVNRYDRARGIFEVYPVDKARAGLTMGPTGSMGAFDWMDRRKEAPELQRTLIRGGDWQQRCLLYSGCFFFLCASAVAFLTAACKYGEEWR